MVVPSLQGRYLMAVVKKPTIVLHNICGVCHLFLKLTHPRVAPDRENRVACCFCLSPTLGGNFYTCETRKTHCHGKCQKT